MRQLPGVLVPAELNSKVREQFKDYIDEFIRYQLLFSSTDMSRFAIFGSYMDFYEEETT